MTCTRVTEMAFTDRAVIHRMKPDRTLEVVSVDVDGIMSGRVADIPLKENDVLFIATKNEVMSERTAKALKEGKEDEAVEMLKTQRAFVGQHLANWVPMFVSDIKYFSQTDLYIGAGELLLGFVQTEVEALDDLLDGVDA